MKCPRCHYNNAYVGITSIECSNDKCIFAVTKMPKQLDITVDDDPTQYGLLSNLSPIWDQPVNQIIEFSLPTGYIGKRLVEITFIQNEKQGHLPCTFSIIPDTKKYTGSFYAKPNINYQLRWYASTDIKKPDPNQWGWSHTVSAIFY